MQTTQPEDRAGLASTTVRFPALGELELDLDDWIALRQQGFVSEERRGPSRVIWKLRFRRQGRQVVRYVGSDARRIERVRAELAELQRARKLDLETKQLVRHARRTMRDGKEQLEPLLVAAGWKFHGLSIRRPRPKPILESADCGSDQKDFHDR